MFTWSRLVLPIANDAIDPTRQGGPDARQVFPTNRKRLLLVRWQQVSVLSREERLYSSNVAAP